MCVCVCTFVFVHASTCVISYDGADDPPQPSVENFRRLEVGEVDVDGDCNLHHSHQTQADQQ